MKGRAEELHSRGLAISTARKKAGEEWDRENPWFKAGNTFGQTSAQLFIWLTELTISQCEVPNVSCDRLSCEVADYC